MESSSTRSIWITAVLFAACGIVAFAGGLLGDGVTTGIGAILVLCAFGVFRFRIASLVAGGMAGVVLASRYAETFASTAPGSYSTSAVAMLTGGLVTAIAAVLGLAALLGPSGGC